MAVFVPISELRYPPSCSAPVVEQVGILGRSQYLADRSGDGTFVFAYEITIANLGTETCQLLDRYWRISDANDKVEIVEGEGVVGHQPVLEPGQAFVYISFCPLRTTWGSMEGHFGFVRPDGRSFQVQVPAFLCMQDEAVQ